MQVAFLNTILLNLLEVKGRKDFDNPALGEVCFERVWSSRSAMATATTIATATNTPLSECLLWVCPSAKHVGMLFFFFSNLRPPVSSGYYCR